MKVETTVIPALRKVYRDTYANLPTSGLTEGDLGFATDREVLYRWSGLAWEAISISSRHGNIADIGDPADYPESSLYQADDEYKLYMVVSGAWVHIATTPVITTQRIAGQIAIPITVEATICEITPNVLPCHLVVIGKIGSDLDFSRVVKITDGNNTALATGSWIVSKSDGGNMGINSLSCSLGSSVVGNQTFILLAIISSGVTTPIKVRITATGEETPSVNVSAEMSVGS